MHKYDISVIICTYNADYSELVEAVDSSIRQKNIRLQLVITDDGSDNDHFESLSEYLSSKGFSDYIMLRHEKNQGIVMNFYDGAVHSDAEHIAGLGQGDFFHDPTVLARWLAFTKRGNYKWTFADSIYYTENGQTRKRVAMTAHPQDVTPYGRNALRCRWNYVVLSDLALGSSIMYEKNTLVAYLNRIKGKVKYAEDHVLRMMMFDGIVGGYYRKPVMYYKYGEGVSTTKDPKWDQRLSDDWKEADRELFSTQKNLFQKIMQIAYLSRTDSRVSNIPLFSWLWGRSRVMRMRSSAGRKTPIG